MNIDENTQIGADGERHAIGEAPTDPAPYRRNPANFEYTPGEPDDWDGDPPTTIAEAIDRLAAAATSP